MFTNLIWKHKFKTLFILLVIFWYVYTRHFSDQAIKYKKFYSIQLGMDTNQVNAIMGKPEYIYYHIDDNTVNYSYNKDVGFLVDMVIKFDSTCHVTRKWVY